MARFRVFRWRAVGPLLLLLAGLWVLWLLFGDRLVEDTGEEAGAELLGTQVDLSGLRIRETDAAMDLARLQIADPFNPDRNLVETGAIVLDLDPAALLEKKLVVDRLVVRDLRFGTARETPARPASGDGFAPTLLRAMGEWRRQFDVPLLSLTPIDTLKQIALDPGQLGTVQAARGVVSAADSLQSAFRRQVDSLDPRPLLDSARALAGRLAGASPARLGVAGTREAVQSLRRTLRDIDGMTRRVDDLRRSAEAGVTRLGEGVAALDEARRQDYAFARSLLQLPSFDAPNIGAALFGRVSIDRLQQAVYWAELAQRYLPPGLRPQARPGPRRLRQSGTTVLFPREREYPSFLLRQGELNLSLEAGGARHGLEAAVAGLASQPALYGRPATVTASGTVGGANPLSLRVDGVLDHTGAVARDSMVARIAGLRLPAIDVPGLPFRVDPGLATTGLSFVRRGDQIAARWSLRSANAAWARDSAPRTAPGDLLWRVVSGLTDLEVTAELTGTFRRPRLAVRSNLDDLLAARLRAILGEELARAEARARAEVDRLVGEQVREARTRVEAYRQEAETRVSGLRQDLDRAKADLEARLRSLTGGLGGLLGS